MSLVTVATAAGVMIKSDCGKLRSPLRAMALGADRRSSNQSPTNRVITVATRPRYP